MGLEDFGLLEGGLGAEELATLFGSPRYLAENGQNDGRAWNADGTEKTKAEATPKKNNLSVEAVLCCVGLALLKLKEPRMVAAADCLQAGGSIISRVSIISRLFFGYSINFFV